MPQLLRIALSDALSFNPNRKIGGAKANFNFSKFRKLKANAGLNSAFKEIKDLKENGNHITEMLSLADLTQLAGASAIEYAGGPYIELRIGRVDEHEDNHIPEDTQLPHPDMDINDIRKYNSLGLTNEEIVALFGMRTLGFLSNKDEHKEKRWTRNPWVFDNNYYEELLDKSSPYIKTPSDIALVSDDEFRHSVEYFAINQQAFFDSFAKMYQKLSELGNDNLLAENKSYLEV